MHCPSILRGERQVMVVPLNVAAASSPQPDSDSAYSASQFRSTCSYTLARPA